MESRLHAAGLYLEYGISEYIDRSARYGADSHIERETDGYSDQYS